MVDSLRERMAKVRLDIPKDTLPISNWRLPPSASTWLTYRNQKILGSFVITGDKKYVKDGRPPKLRLPANRTNLRIDLEKGYSEAVLIASYKEYYNLKHEYFLKWILDEFAQSDYQKFDFVCFGGRIADTLKTPCNTRYSEWKFHAVKYGRVVFLWDFWDDDNDQRPTLTGYCGPRFEHVLTTDDPDMEEVNEYSKYFVVREFDFGQYKLACLHEMDAINDRNEYVELKVYSKPSWKVPDMRSNHLKYWAQSIVAGVDTLILGKRGNDGFLKQIDIVTVAELPKQTYAVIEPVKCYDFQHRLLKWIRGHLEEADVVKKFSKRPRMDVVTCEDVERNSPAMLPKWFVDGVAKALRNNSVSSRK